MDEKDTYGSTIREKMKESMAEPWKATNKIDRRKQPSYAKEIFWCLMLAAIGVLVIFIYGTLPR